MNQCLYVMVAILSHLCLSEIMANPKDSVLKVKKVNDFEIKGDGSASEWARAEWATLTRSKGPLNYNTKFKTIYSDKGIYCLFVCEDSKITSTLKEDFADLYTEDVVEVFFWPDESMPLYFEYEMSPTNYELPIIIPNHNGDFFGWRPWHYEGERKTRHATNIVQEKERVKSWTAESFIPFALLKPLQNSPPKKGTRWRANFYRIDYDENYTSWSWRSTLTNFHEFKRFGTIEFE